MAIINNAWNNNLLSDSSVASTIDDMLNRVCTAVQERMQNSGHSWPTAAALATDGIHAVGTANKVSGEWSVYKSDLATKMVTVTDTAVALNANTAVTGNVTVSGNETVSGTLNVTGLLTASAQKRRFTYRWNKVSGDGSTLTNIGVMVPFYPLTLGTFSSNGTIAEVAFFTESSQARTVTVYKNTPSLAAGKFTGNPFNVGGASTVTTLTTTAGQYGAVAQPASAVTSGDFIFVNITAGSTTYDVFTFEVTIELTY